MRREKNSIFTAALRYVQQDFLYELFACALIAAGVSVFLAPNRIVSGGVTGVATVLYQLLSER